MRIKQFYNDIKQLNYYIINLINKLLNYYLFI